MISELTYKVIGYGYVSRLISDDVIDWAQDMLSLNYTAPSLYTIASIPKKSPFYEVLPYLEKALNELGLSRKTDIEAWICYCRYYIYEIAQQENIRKNIKTLHEICIHEDYLDEIYDFYLLNNAWVDYEFDPEYPFNHYWRGATAKNISRICVKVAEEWLNKYESQWKL